jgi:hypothetical protein
VEDPLYDGGVGQADGAEEGGQGGLAVEQGGEEEA